jgi:hypothetical protein
MPPEIRNALDAWAQAAAILPDRMDSSLARVMLVAIGLQESLLIHRRQIGGPARGLWQFERGGGVRGVLAHHATKTLAESLCRHFVVPSDQHSVYNALEHNDPLAAGFARLNLWWMPAPLPRICDEAGAWEHYIEAWRPGKPHLRTWSANYRAAVEAVTS